MTFTFPFLLLGSVIQYCCYLQKAFLEREPRTPAGKRSAETPEEREWNNLLLARGGSAFRRRKAFGRRGKQHTR